MIGQFLEINIGQRQTLSMTSELITALAILQYDAQELDSYIEEQLLSNPVLEAAEKPEPEPDVEAGEVKEESAETQDDPDYLMELLNDRGYDDISYSHMSSRDSDESSTAEAVSKYGSPDDDVSLTEYLMFQLHLTDLPERRKEIGAYIIESLEPSGYLTRSPADIAYDIGTKPEKVNEVIEVIQGFDPPGIAARNLRECLLLQLKALGIEDESTLTIAEKYIPDLAANHIAAIAQAMSVPVSKVQEAADLIRGLEPKPGIAFGEESDNHYIVPDIIVEAGRNGYVAQINDHRIPRLFVIPYYRELLKNRNTDEHVTQYLKGHISSAVNLIRNIEHRNKTISLVADAIIRRQSEYMKHGDNAMKPMTLRDIASEVGIHESTVSRAIRGKYMQTPQGVVEIKHLFSGSVGKDHFMRGIGGGGGESTRRSIKSRIKKLVDDENPKHPLSDQNITDVLRAEGIIVSRRAIAKYRDELRIASSSRRRRY